MTFRRSVRPELAVGNPELIGYFDGSDNAYAAVAYLRWTLEDGSFDIHLACSKAKVTPLKRISTPRSELNGAVLLNRLILFYVKTCVSSGITPERVWLFGDSECTLSSIEKTSGALGEYFGNRVGEVLDNQRLIQKFCPVGIEGEWYHLSSSDNSADQPTRLDSTIHAISPSSRGRKARVTCTLLGKLGQLTGISHPEKILAFQRQRFLSATEVLCSMSLVMQHLMLESTI